MYPFGMGPMGQMPWDIVESTPIPLPGGDPYMSSGIQPIPTPGFAGPMGEPAAAFDPTFGVQMPDPYEATPFDFNPRQGLGMPLMQAGAAMMRAAQEGNFGFGEAMGALSQGLGREREVQYRDWQADQQRQRQEYQDAYRTAREQIGDERFGYQAGLTAEDRERRELDRGLAESEADRKDIERIEGIEATGRALGIARDPLESISEYEARLKVEAGQRQVQEEKDWWMEQERIRQGNRSDPKEFTRNMVVNYADKLKDNPQFAGMSEVQRLRTAEALLKGDYDSLSDIETPESAMGPPADTQKLAEPLSRLKSLKTDEERIQSLREGQKRGLFTINDLVYLGQQLGLGM